MNDKFDETIWRNLPVCGSPGCDPDNICEICKRSITNILAAHNAAVQAALIEELEGLAKTFSPDGLGFVQIDEEEAMTILLNRIAQLKSPKG